MTNYCTVQDVRNALTPKGLSADNTEAGKTAATLPDWQIIDAINEAETLIDAFVKARYTIENEDVEEPTDPADDPPIMGTVSVAPKPIRLWTRTIAAYFATLTFREGKDLEERDPIQLRFITVMQLLTGVRNGTFDIPLPPIDPADVDAGVEIVNIYEGDLFALEDFGLAQVGSSAPQVYVPRYPSW